MRQSRDEIEACAMTLVQTSETRSAPKRQLEEKLLRQVDRSGPQSTREFAIFQKAHSREEIEACVAVLVQTGELVPNQGTKTVKYARPAEGEHQA